jgi:hypothetical protein
MSRIPAKEWDESIESFPLPLRETITSVWLEQYTFLHPQGLADLLSELFQSAPGLGPAAAGQVAILIKADILVNQLPGHMLIHEPERALAHLQDWVKDMNVGNTVKIFRGREYRALTRAQLRLVREWWIKNGGWCDH